MFQKRKGYVLISIIDVKMRFYSYEFFENDLNVKS